MDIMKQTDIAIKVAAALAVVFIIFFIVALVIYAEDRVSSREKALKPKLSEVNCGNLDDYYDSCYSLSFSDHVTLCRERYTPKLMQCYGAGKLLIQQEGSPSY
jgi:hypothetical protein